MRELAIVRGDNPDLALAEVMPVIERARHDGELLAEKVDRREFIDLLKRMLTMDQERRITPSEASHVYILIPEEEPRQRIKINNVGGNQKDGLSQKFITSICSCV